MPQRKLFDKKTLDALKKHPLYSQDGKGDAAVAYARIFNPYGRGAWYITEYDGEDTMYGYYKDSDNSDDGEYGYISKSEMENTRVRIGGVRLPLERDASFKPSKLGSVRGGSTSLRNNTSFADAEREQGNASTTSKGGANK